VKSRIFTLIFVASCHSSSHPAPPKCETFDLDLEDSSRTMIKMSGTIRRSREMDPGFGCLEICHEFYMGKYGIDSSKAYMEKQELLKKHVGKNVSIWGYIHRDIKNRVDKVTRLEFCSEDLCRFRPGIRPSSFCRGGLVACGGTAAEAAVGASGAPGREPTLAFEGVEQPEKARPASRPAAKSRIVARQGSPAWGGDQSRKYGEVFGRVDSLRAPPSLAFHGKRPQEFRRLGGHRSEACSPDALEDYFDFDSRKFFLFTNRQKFRSQPFLFV